MTASFQSAAMVGAAAVGHRGFFEQPPPRGGFAGVEDLASSAGHGIDKAARQGGHAGEVLHEVQGGAFRGEDRREPAGDLQDRFAGGRGVAILTPQADVEGGIDGAEDAFRDFQSGENCAGLFAKHPGAAESFRRHERRGGHVASLPEILLESGHDEGIRRILFWRSHESLIGFSVFFR